MPVQDWWERIGKVVDNPDDLIPVLAKELARIVVAGVISGVSVNELRQSEDMKLTGVRLNVEPERPQELEYPIIAVEPIAVIFPFDCGQPSILSLRENFPDTPHQNWVPSGMPCSLCIDDRPWAEAQLTATGFDIARRILLWLSKAARGDLHDDSQPPEPLFFNSQLKLIVPATIVSKHDKPVELIGFICDDRPNFLFTEEVQSPEDQTAFTVLAFQAQPRKMTRLRHAPRTLAALALELEACGIALYDELKSCLVGLAGLKEAEVRQSSAKLVIIIAFPVTTDRQPNANDIRAFVTHVNAGEIGVALGVLHKNFSEVGDKQAYMLAVPEGELMDKDLLIDPAQVHFWPNREDAASIAGRNTSDQRRTVLVGAGSLGSQLALNLAREGQFIWTVVDDDHLLPHNLFRHVLFVEDVGKSKANALAQRLSRVLAETVEAIHCNVLNQTECEQTQLSTTLADADIIIDASASVAVSRHLSDMSEISSRRICTFFNPAGTSIVLLVESADRSLTLRDLEAQYFRIVISDTRVSGHLAHEESGVRYSGSCRALTNRIPASSAALLSALAARGLDNALSRDEATISIWTLADNGEVQCMHRKGEPVTRAQVGNWTLIYDDGLISDLSDLRSEKLPNETGGALLGIIDMSRRFVHVVHGLPETEDSIGTESSFERGIVGLHEQLSNTTAATMHQLRYVGEWHTHPVGATAMPSLTDLAQLAWLTKELEIEGLPGLIAIAAGDGNFCITLSDAKEG